MYTQVQARIAALELKKEEARQNAAISAAASGVTVPAVLVSTLAREAREGEENAISGSEEEEKLLPAATLAREEEENAISGRLAREATSRKNTPALTPLVTVESSAQKGKKEQKIKLSPSPSGVAAVVATPTRHVCVCVCVCVCGCLRTYRTGPARHTHTHTHTHTHRQKF
jgi:hypothetical protein